MRVATWNVNNVLKRLDQLLDWLRRRQPDVVALQELKAVTEDFPVDALEAVGYRCLVVGQKTWNGVALLARGHEPLPVLTALPPDPHGPRSPPDREARYVEAAINGVLFGCLYAVNGNPRPGPKFDYKLAWLKRLRSRSERLWATGQPVVLLGDWNVVPTDQDIYKPDTWRDDALLQPESRAAFEAILAQGWTDAIRATHPANPPPFTFWDYRRKRWERDAGLRIDHILVSAALQVQGAGVDKDERGHESPSDHAPVWAELKPASKSKPRRRTRVDGEPAESGSTPSARPAPPAGPVKPATRLSLRTKRAAEDATTKRSAMSATRGQAQGLVKYSTTESAKGSVKVSAKGSAKNTAGATDSGKAKRSKAATVAARETAGVPAAATAKAKAKASASATATATATGTGTARATRSQRAKSDPETATAAAEAKSNAARTDGSGNARPEPLARYNQKRNFSKTAEPAGRHGPIQTGAEAPLQFVIQKHWASRLHYDFRLELDGVMLSWAVPKGPTFDPALKQMAIHVEDHPLDYNEFEGTIPKGEYGAGTVIVWDRGTWSPTVDAREGLAKGKLIFKLHGQKLAGLWELVRISKPGEKKQDQWLLLKKRGDAWVRSSADYDVITALPDSIVAKPLGLVEEREPRGTTATLEHSPADVAQDMRRAKKAPLPATLSPQLATLASAAPAGDWIVETKFDGYRMLARVDGPEVRLFTRSGNDWTHKFEPLADAIAALGIHNGWLDGEIVVMNEAGVPDFNALQNAIDSRRTKRIDMFLFDVPFLNGMDLRAVPLVTRRQLLKELLDGREGDSPGTQTADVIRYSPSFAALPHQMLNAACQLGLEGVMLKRADASYASGRTETWLKLKCQLRQEFVVIGFTDRANSRSEVGSLLLGYYEDGELKSAGSVGTGWSAATGKALRAMLDQLETDQPTVSRDEVKPGRWSRRSPGTERWVTPTAVVEVAFSEWTPEGQVRHASFRGVRTDKPATSIVRERAQAVGPAPAPTSERRTARPPSTTTTTITTTTTTTTPTSIKVTNPDRVVDPSTGTRKRDVVRFYESVADWILPHLRGRPVSLVRAPQGITGQLFFHKHPDTKMPGLTELDASLWPGHTSLMSVDSVEALLSAAQMNTIEFHTWNSKAKDIDRPDRVIFDLDPGEGVNWSMLQEAALLMRTLLNEMQLESWLKTSGGKGLHVVVPLTPKLDYAMVKQFSQTAVQHMAKTIPSRFVAKSGGANRVGKIFIDYLRNGHGQTTAAAFSARARPGMGVSMPVAWEQLKELKGGAQWTIATAREYLSLHSTDPWAAYWKKRQTLTHAMKLLKP